LRPLVPVTIHKPSFPTSQETHCTLFTKTNLFMLFREIISVYSDNHIKYINEICDGNAEFFNFKAGGIYCHDLGVTVDGVLD
jgi:hypothetical protein